jgi:sortase A
MGQAPKAPGGRSPRLITCLVVLLAADAALITAAVTRGGDAASVTAAAPVDNPIASITTVTHRPGATTTTTEPQQPIKLPVPQPAPEDEYADVPIVEIGRLQIPALDLDTKMYEGVWLTVINYGPSHWPGTAMPGELGNVVVAGHRVTHSRPFRNLDTLEPGDQAIFTTSAGTFTYDFVSLEIVTPDRTDIVAQNIDYTATMFACHPPGSARERIVAHWRLVGAPPLPTGGGSITISGG